MRGAIYDVTYNRLGNVGLMHFIKRYRLRLANNASIWEIINKLMHIKKFMDMHLVESVSYGAKTLNSDEK